MHVDVKKLGNIPDGGGWRYVGRHQGEKHRAATQSKSRNVYGGPKAGYAFVTPSSTTTPASPARGPRQRRDALAGWLHQYDHHRPRTTCGNQPPFSRLINVPGQYTWRSRIERDISRARAVTFSRYQPVR